MKIKRLFSVVALGLFGLVSAGGGLALVAKANIEPVKADDPKTWMVRFQFNLSEASPSDPESEFSPKVVGMELHYWGDNVDETVPTYYMFDHLKLGQDFYGVNVSLTDSQNIQGIQWRMLQEGYASSESIDITSFGTIENHVLDKNSPYFAIGWQYSGSWTQEGKFNVFNEAGSQVVEDILLEWEGSGAGSFTKNPETNEFVYSSHIADENHTFIGIRSGDLSYGDSLDELLTIESRKNVKSCSGSTIYLKDLDEAHYRIAITNQGLSIKKHDVQSSYIYFVSQSDAQDNNLRAYTYGYNEAHGDWDHRTHVNESEWSGLDYVEPAHGFKFQNQNHKVYRMSIDFNATGSDCDDHIIFTDDEKPQSANLLIEGGAAYWMGTSAESYNMEAGIALDLFYDLQNALKEADPYGDLNLSRSICSLTTAQAANFYDRFAEFSDVAKDAYFDCSYINTYNGPDSAYESYHSATEVFNELGVIGGRITSTDRMISNPSNSIEASTLIILISVITLASITSIAIIMIIKKRKYNK